MIPAAPLSIVFLVLSLVCLSRTLLWPRGAFFPVMIYGGSYVRSLSPGAEAYMTPEALGALFPSGPLADMQALAGWAMAILLGAAGLLSASLLGRRSNASMLLAFAPWAPFAILAAASILWSDDAMRSIAACGTWLILSVAAIRVGLALTAATVNRTAIVACLVLLGASVLVELTGWGSLSARGAWQGVFSHKNHFGWFLVVTLALLLGDGRGLSVGVRIGAALLCLGALYEARSATSIAAAMSVLSFAAIARLLRRSRLSHGLTVAATGAILVSTALFGLLLFPSLTSVLGRDETLTGRTEVWTAYWPLIQSRFLYGHGPATFTGSPHVFQIAQLFYDRMKWAAPHAHSTYVVLLGEVGLPGLVFYVAALIYIIMVGGGGLKSYMGLTAALLALASLLGGVTEPRGGVEPTASIVLTGVYFAAAVRERKRSSRKRSSKRRRSSPVQSEEDLALIKSSLGSRT